MEGIREQIVKKRGSKSASIKGFLIFVASFILAMLVGTALVLISPGRIMGLFAYLLGMGIVYGGLWLAGKLKVEYEYSVVSDELTVSKVINMHSRDGLCVVNLRSAEGFYLGEKQLHDATEINVCGDGECYSIVYNDPKYGKSVLVFTPDERILEAIKPYLPRLQ